MTVCIVVDVSYVLMVVDGLLLFDSCMLGWGWVTEVWKCVGYVVG